MSKTFLVTGATGFTGRNTVRFLIEAGAQVRALVHREDDRSEALKEQGATLIQGDLTDFGAVRKAVDGVNGAYFVFPIMPGIVQGTAYFAQAARDAGLDIVVNMSQISARREARSHAAHDHWIAEQVFNWSGVPVVHLQPTLFAEWALYWIDQIKTGTLRLPFGTGKHAPISTEDQGRVIADILLNPAEHISKVYPLYGEKEYTFPEIAAEISKVSGKPLVYQQVDAFDLKKLVSEPNTQARQRYERYLHDDTLWQHFQEIAKDHQNGVFAGTNDVVERITGRKPISLPDFLERYKVAFA